MKSKARPFKRIVGPDLDTWAPLPYAKPEAPETRIPLPIHHWGTWKWLAQDGASRDPRFVAVRLGGGREDEWAQKFVAESLFLWQPGLDHPDRRDWIERRGAAVVEFYDVDEFVRQRFEAATTKEVFGYVVALAECFRAEVAKIDTVPPDFVAHGATVDDVRIILRARFIDWLCPIYTSCYGSPIRPAKEEYLP